MSGRSGCGCRQSADPTEGNADGVRACGVSGWHVKLIGSLRDMAVHGVSYFPTAGNEESCHMVAGVVRHGSGMALVLGGVGVGKTLFLQRLATELASDKSAATIRIVSLAVVPLRSADEWLAFVASELGFIPASPSPLAWRQHLRKAAPLVLLIDDADALTWEMLDEIRVWSDFGIRCVLAGNPSLEETLTHTRLVPFNQRVAARCYLEMWLGADTKAFLRRELGSVPITSGAVTLVHRLTDGVPRLIDQLTRRLIQANKTSVDESLVQSQWNQFQAIPSSAYEPHVTTTASTCDFNDDLNDDLAGTDGAWIEFGESAVNVNAPDRVIQDNSVIQDCVTQEPVELVLMPPAYVYQTTEPVTPQYPCYIDKNIAMMNWVAPGHRVASGSGTPYIRHATYYATQPSPQTATFQPASPQHTSQPTSLDEMFDEEVLVTQHISISQPDLQRPDPQISVPCETAAVVTAATRVECGMVDRLERVTEQLTAMMEQLHGVGGRVERAIERTVAAVSSSVERIVDASLAPPIQELLEMFVDFEQECRRELEKSSSNHEPPPLDIPHPVDVTRNIHPKNVAAMVTACRGVPLMRLFHGDEAIMNSAAGTPLRRVRRAASQSGITEDSVDA